jgi:two-component system, NarL family, invasion response regulator UvrY
MGLASVLLVDDDMFTRTTLSAALSAGGINVVAATDSAAGALENLLSLDPDVAIVDLDLGPGPSGIDICHALRSQKPNLGLILLTSYTDPRIHDPSNSQLPKGCRFVSKSELSDFKFLIEEIIIARNKPFAPAKLRKVNDHKLTDVQLEVLIGVAQGLSSAEIATNRGVSVKAIEGIIAKTHVALGINKSKSINLRVQLVRAYFELTGKMPPNA